MTAVRINELPAHVDHVVTLRGWAMTTRSSGKIAFLVLRDGTGQVQCVVSRKEVPEPDWTAFGTITQETSVEVTGTVRAEPRSPGGYELTGSGLSLLRPSPDNPVTPKEHGQ